MSSEENEFNNILDLMKKHHDMFANAIPLIASENISSPTVREAVASDLAHRYAEGWAGKRVYAGNEFFDQIELKCIDLAKKYWRAGFADVRPISGVLANLITYTALTQPGDKMMAMPIAQGGHISHNRTAVKVHGLNVDFFEFNEEEMNLDIDKSIKNLRNFKPKLVLFGASVFLFPHPVKEISEVAKGIGAKVMYDGAHVAGLIGSGYFQQPLEEGADVFTLSTHKTFPGPQHGCVLAIQDEELNKNLRIAAFPALLSNHHLNNVAALAITLTEMLKFGKEYHRQVIKNAKALAQSLHERGFDVLAEKKGFTESHTIVADISKLSKTIGWGDKVQELLEKARIILNRNLIPRDIKENRSFRTPSGIRLGTSEVTRLGMKESEMDYIAELIERACIKQQDIESVKNMVKEFRKDFQEVKYCFKSKTKAYEYVHIP